MEKQAKKNRIEQEDSGQQQIKIIANRYEKQLTWLQAKGKEIYGQRFRLQDQDHLVLCRLLCYFLKDEETAVELNIDLKKGILLTGPVGCGKTTLMNLMRYFQPQQERFIVKSCRDVSFEFIRDGYDIIHKYSNRSFKSFEPIIYCFDDLGIENNLKYFGNECNVMAEVLLSRYDQFISRKLITHLTTNLSASEMEELYGNRVRSRMRELFNLFAFDNKIKDKRK